jgi:hypothetical protein
VNHLLTTIDDIGSYLTNRSAAVLCGLALLAVVLKHGLWLAPGIADIQAIARAPTAIMLSGEAQWKYYSFFVPFLAYATGTQGSVFSIAWIGLTFLLVGLIISFWRTHSNYGTPVLSLFLVVLVASPATASALTWLGYADSVTLAAWFLFVAVQRHDASALLGAIMGINHFEMGLVGV